MKRKQTISLADDRRARVPFALIAVVLLTTSVVTVTMINQRSTPEVDISPDLVHERTTQVAQSVISEAASDAISEAGEQPVTKAGDGPVGETLASGDASADTIFKRYVKLRIYTKINQRLSESSQTISGPHGEARGSAFLPALESDETSISNALDRISLEIGSDPEELDYSLPFPGYEAPNDDSEEDESDKLDRGEYRVSVDGVQHTVSVGGDEIHRQQQSYNATGETAVFEMHAQVNEYQNSLDDHLDERMYVRMMPLLFAQAWTEYFLGRPLEAFAWQKLVTNQELVVHSNLANYNIQQSVFGTTDQSYPTMAAAGRGCLAHYYAGQFIVGLAKLAFSLGGGDAGAALRGGSLLGRFTQVISYPAEGLCYYTMYAEADQSTKGAPTNVPSVAAFADEDTEWVSEETPYNETENAAERFDQFNVEPSEVDVRNGIGEVRNRFSDFDEENNNRLAELNNKMEIDGQGQSQMSPNSEQEIKIDPIANQVYAEMFDVDEDQFDYNKDMPDFEGDKYPEGLQSDEASDSEDISITATEAEQEDANRLRQRLINDIDPIELSVIQFMSSDNVFGEMIYQIEQNAELYIYDDTYETSAYGVRNAYLQQVINRLEDAEKARKKQIEKLERLSGNDSFKESLVKQQAAIEGNATNPERIEEIADNAAYESKGPGVDRFDIENVDRDLFVWWDLPEEDNADRVATRLDSRNEDKAGVPADIELSSNGVPETVTKSMLFKFGDGGLPESTETTTTTSIGMAPSDLDDGKGMYPREIDEENRTDGAYVWNIRPVDLEKSLYRITNGQLLNRSLSPAPTGGFVINGSEERTYMQLHRVNATMDLTEEAAEAVGLTSPRSECEERISWLPGDRCDGLNDDASVTKDRYIITPVDVPQTSDKEEGIDVDEKELAAPELRPADREDFKFNIHASPGYLTGLPIVREVDPNVRPPGKGPLFGRGAPFAPFSSKVFTPVPNPGMPILPPPLPWVLSSNFWKTDLQGEYARFELRSNTSNGLDTGPETYVRYDGSVEMDIGGQSTTVGSVEPISLEASNYFPMVVPGLLASVGMVIVTRGKLTTSFGTGDNLNIESANALPSVPTGVQWTPEKCTPAWPEVGPGVEPKSLDRDCADWGPIVETLSQRLGEGLVSGSALIHVAMSDKPDPGDYRNNCKINENGELELIGTNFEDRDEFKPCVDLGPRSRHTNT